LKLNISPFDLKETFECGQCFRWNENPDGSYTGIAFGRVLNIQKKDGEILLSDSSPVWEEYFDLNTDYNAIIESLKTDSVMEGAIKDGCGIRILKQEFSESVISFIISQNNNIPRIKTIIENLCKSFGKNLGSNCFSFPEMSTLAELSPEDLSFLKAGYRDSYIIDAAQKRSETTMTERLANELLDALANKGSAVKKREDTHRMAEANKAFSHYKF